VSGIHQFVPIVHAGDAVGQHAMALRAALRDRGADSEVYVETRDPETARQTRMASDYPAAARPGDLLVYQFATVSDLAAWLVGRPEPLVVNYHNVTPASFFAPWDDALARHQVRARSELEAMAGRATLGVADSEWNRGDLDEAGFVATAVVPPIVALAGERPEDGRSPDERPEGGRSPDERPEDGRSPDERPEDGPPRRRGARWLAVGRLAPNKALEDTLTGFLAYRTRYDPAAELLVVGKTVVPAYTTALRCYAAELGLADAVRFAGRVTDAALAAAYQSADVLVVASEHEGFCLPAVEAMAGGLPVVAYSKGALPEVLGGAGVLLASKDPLTMAGAVHRVQTDRRWRQELVRAGRRRVGSLGLEDAGARLAELLLAVRDGRPWPDSVGARKAAGRPAG